MSRFSSIALLCLLFAAQSLAAQGIRGRASLDGAFVDTVRIRVYELRKGGFGPYTGDAPVASVQSDTDGQYSIEVKPGRYIVEAIKKMPGGEGSAPVAGDLYCLYSGSPVTVMKDQWTTTGLYLTTVKPETRSKTPSTRLAGRITFKEENLEKVYLYAYRSVEDLFRGPADILQPVAKGTFSLVVPPGTWYLVARKRMKGGAYGPIEPGDKINFYAMNPVKIAEGETVTLNLPMAERLSWLEAEETRNRGLLLRIVDAKGKPRPEYHVLAYETTVRSGHPVFASERSDGNGEVTLPLTLTARHLRIRKNLGGPLGDTEEFADVDLDQSSLSGKNPLVIVVK